MPSTVLPLAHSDQKVHTKQKLTHEAEEVGRFIFYPNQEKRQSYPTN